MAGKCFGSRNPDAQKEIDLAIGDLHQQDYSKL
jgi:hypothetical protein